MYINQSRCGQVQGIDILSGCKGEKLAAAQRDQANLADFFFSRADPGKQFDLVVSHLQNIKRLPGFEASRFTIYVERNLGFEAGEIFLH